MLQVSGSKLSENELKVMPNRFIVWINYNKAKSSKKHFFRFASLGEAKKVLLSRRWIDRIDIWPNFFTHKTDNTPLSMIHNIDDKNYLDKK